jgi:hypothetical protein
VKEIVTVHAFKDDVGDALYQQLVGVYRDESSPHSFYARLPATDARMVRIRQLLSASRPSTFMIDIDRIYEPADLEAARLLEVFPGRWNNQVLGEDPERRLKIPIGSVCAEVDIIGSPLPARYILPERVRKILARGRFKHLAFRPTVCYPGRRHDAKAPPRPWPPSHEPWWEIDSDFILPPLSDTMTFVNRKSQVIKERVWTNGFICKEPPYRNAELHYRARDLEGLPPFDVARCYEAFTNVPSKEPDHLQRPVIVSQRFYRYCVKHNLQFGWIPVRLDPD